MGKIKSLTLNVVLVGFVSFTMSGCSTMMEGLQSQMEVPSLENQANRVAIGMTIVRENHIMALKMPISADAQWPALVAADINDSEDEFIINSLMDEPYFATAHYTELIQRKKLGSSASMNMLGDYSNLTSMALNQTVKPLTKRAVQKIIILYGRDRANWPNMFKFGSSLDNFLEFKEGKLKEIEAVSGDVYESIGEAVISLAPINMKKDLTLAREEMLDGFGEVASIKSQKGELETQLKEKRSKNRRQIKKEIAVLEARVSEAESIADEKEAVYFGLLDQTLIALESDINIDDENYVKLAQNVNIVSDEIQVGATQAYASFTLAAGNIASSDVLKNFQKELESLAIGKVNVPANLQSKYNRRVEMLAKNALYIMPNILVGTYYATKQITLAQKYEDFTSIILLAHEAKTEQETAAKKAEDK